MVVEGKVLLTLSPKAARDNLERVNKHPDNAPLMVTETQVHRTRSQRPHALRDIVELWDQVLCLWGPIWVPRNLREQGPRYKRTIANRHSTGSTSPRA